MTFDRPDRLLRRTGRAALGLTAILGTVGLLVTVLALVTGVRPLIFRSGSMSPQIAAGALGFAHTANAPDLRVGDIVTVTTTSGVSVTHRIVTVTHHLDVATLQLKGDANTAPDSELYQVHQAKRLWFAVPRAGYAVAWFSHPPGTYLLALYVGVMLMLIARRRKPESPSAAGTDIKQGHTGPSATAGVVHESVEPGAVRTRVRKHRGAIAAVVSTGISALVLAAIAGWAVPTWALWTKTAVVSGTSISTGTWPPAAPSISACTRNASSGNITVTWSAVPGATSYNLKLSNPSSTITGVTSPYTTTTIAKNATGTVIVTAVNSGGSSNSVAWTYDGTGSNQACHA